jgi:molybdopterin synthase sulfur carrier subunit
VLKLANVRIPTPLQNLTGGLSEVQVDGNNLLGLIDSLDSSYPGVKERILDESGNIRRFINIYVDEEDVRFLDGLETGIEGNTEVSIVPAVAGGI